MTTPPADFLFRAAMNRGHKLMQAGLAYLAVGELKSALELAATPEERAEANQMIGVQCRSLVWLHKAIEYGQQAVDELVKYNNVVLRANAQRDLAMTHHKLLLRLKMLPSDPGTDAHIASATWVAKELFTSSLIVLEGKGQELAAEYAVTLGAFGALYCDTGKPVQGMQRIEQADIELRALDHPVFELNNLLKLMRYSGFTRRLRYLPRALRLTSRRSASPGARRKVVAALAGHRIITRIELRKAEV